MCPIRLCHVQRCCVSNVMHTLGMSSMMVLILPENVTVSIGMEKVWAWVFQLCFSALLLCLGSEESDNCWRLVLLRGTEIWFFHNILSALVDLSLCASSCSSNLNAKLCAWMLILTLLLWTVQCMSQAETRTNVKPDVKAVSDCLYIRCWWFLIPSYVSSDSNRSKLNVLT